MERRYQISVISLLVILFFNTNCNLDSNNKCKEDVIFKSFFKNSIQTLSCSYYIGENFAPSAISNENARFFLELITHEKSLIQNGAFFSIYGSEDDFKKDIINWEKWFQNNRCNFGLHEVDSIYSVFLLKQEKKMKDLQSPKFPNDWKLLFKEKGWGFIQEYSSEGIDMDSIRVKSR